MGLFDRRTPPQGSVLPTPHGPADAPLPADAADAAAPGDDLVAEDLDEDLDDGPITPVWPARPGGPHAVAAAGDPAAGTTPLVPVVPAVPGRDLEVPQAPAHDTDRAAGAPAVEAVGVVEDRGVEPVAEAVAAPPAAPVTGVVEPGPAAPAPADLSHTVDELNPAERIWLAQQRALVADLCDDPTDAAAVAALFDRVRTQWAEAPERPDPRPLTDAFGVALGDLVVGQAPALRWAAASDRYGTEIVLAHGTPEVLVYPLASVGQYWEDARPGWFAGQVERLTQTVRAALAAG